MKTRGALRFGVAVLLVVASAACNRPDNSPHEARKERGISLVVTHSEGEVSVRVENDSEESVVLADEPLIGFGQGGHRVELVPRDKGGNISPCANLDPLRYPRPPDTLEPGQNLTKTVSLDLIRKVYCLKPGHYELLATYSSGTVTPITSPPIVIGIE